MKKLIVLTFMILTSQVNSSYASQEDPSTFLELARQALTQCVELAKAEDDINPVLAKFNNLAESLNTNEVKMLDQALISTVKGVIANILPDEITVLELSLFPKNEETYRNSILFCAKFNAAPFADSLIKDKLLNACSLHLTWNGNADPQLKPAINAIYQQYEVTENHKSIWGAYWNLDLSDKLVFPITLSYAKVVARPYRSALVAGACMTVWWYRRQDNLLRK
jgi:hypothetical protein